eukprot:5106286-Prymnesium_polylepis.1
MPAMAASGHIVARTVASSGRFVATATHGNWRQRSWHPMPGGSSAVAYACLRLRDAAQLLQSTGWA